MKKGISLIVLVITIIVLAILAGAVIVSLSGDNTTLISEATDARTASKKASIEAAVSLAYSQAIARGWAKMQDDTSVVDLKALDSTGNVMDAADYAIATGYTEDDINTYFTITNGEPKVKTTSES